MHVFRTMGALTQAEYWLVYREGVEHKGLAPSFISELGDMTWYLRVRDANLTGFSSER